MRGHFTLTLGPDALERAARELRQLARGFDDRSRETGRAAASLASAWRGPAASMATAEVQGLARVTGRAAAPLVGAAAALTALARDQRHALEVDVPSLNRRWEQAEAEHRASLRAAAAQQADAVQGIPRTADATERSTLARDAGAAADRAARGADAALRAEQARLTAEFASVREALRFRTRATGARLGEAVLVAVPNELAAMAAAGGLLGGIASLVGIDAGSALAADLPMTGLVDALRTPPRDLAALEVLLGQARAVGLPPVDYRPALETYWQLKACAAAGIDPAAWDTSQGADRLRGVIEQVYAYYGAAFLSDRDLQWSGMAAMIGPSFASGFLDLAMVRDWAQRVSGSPLPVGVDGAVLRGLADLTDADLAAYEQRFLEMQKEIFLDQAPMHEAYRTRGIEGIRELVAAGVVDPRTGRAWEDIASGDPARVSAGNEHMLLREQRDIIRDDYDAMLDRPTGPAVTWAATLVGAPSIPGARSFPEVFPVVVEHESPGPSSIFGRDNPLQVTTVITTPLPAGNVADYEDRWDLIEQDTLPRYRDVLADGTAAEDLLSVPVRERIEEHRLSEQWDDILRRIATSTDVDVRQ